MKIQLAIVIIIPFLIGCNSKQKSTKQSKEQQYLTRLKNDTSNSKLMFDLHFGMNRREVQKMLNDLLTTGEILSIDSQGFCYKTDISQLEIPTTFDEDGEGNNRTPPFNELYFYAVPAFSNNKLCSINIIQFLHFSSDEIKAWMNKDLTVLSNEINMRMFAEKCIRVIAATDNLLKTKYSFFDVQKVSIALSQNSQPSYDRTTYWANDFYITMSDRIKYTKYDFPSGSGFEGFGKKLLYSSFSGYKNVVSFNESEIVILEYKSPKYDNTGISHESLFPME